MVELTVESSEDLHRRIRELEAMVDHLADANIRAAELVAELEEARAVEEALRRRAEEMELQQRVERALAGARTIQELATEVTRAMVESPAIECGGAALYLCEAGAPLLVEARGAPPDVPGRSACERFAVEVAWRPNGGVRLALRAKSERLGVLCLSGPRRTEWRERWQPILRTFGIQLGNAIERLQVEADNRLLVQALAVARDRALEATQAKDRFLATMSHELRTPLNAIIGYSELLQEDAAEAGDASTLDDLRRIASSGKHLLALINDVLDLAKIEAGKIDVEREPFDLTELLGEVREIIHPLIGRGRNRLRTELVGELGEMISDAGKLRQVLLNLLGNACKFTADGEIVLSARADPSGDRLLLEVRDSGIGMTEDELARIFEPFVQADATTTRRYGGTGLGLTITGNYITLMGGSISVHSTPGEGTTFTLDLPRVCPAAAPDLADADDLDYDDDADDPLSEPWPDPSDR